MRRRTDRLASIQRAAPAWQSLVFIASPVHEGGKTPHCKAVMFTILQTVLPVFLVLGSGYASARTGWFTPEAAGYLNAFAVRLAVPALLFAAMLKLDFGAAMQPGMLLGFYTGALASFAIAIFIARTFWRQPADEAVATGFCALFSNTVLLGIPIVSRAYGDTVLTPVYGIIAFHAASLYAVGMLAMEFARRDDRPVRQTLAVAAKSVIANPLMIGVLLGAAINLSGMPFPEFIEAAVNMLADAAIPAALVGMGAALARYALKAELARSLVISALSLVVHPAIAFVITWGILGLPADYVRAATMLAAMPPGMNIYIFALLYERSVALSASSVLVATALSVISISLWLALLQGVLG